MHLECFRVIRLIIFFVFSCRNGANVLIGRQRKIAVTRPDGSSIAICSRAASRILPPFFVAASGTYQVNIAVSIHTQLMVDRGLISGTLTLDRIFQLHLLSTGHHIRRQGVLLRRNTLCIKILLGAGVLPRQLCRTRRGRPIAGRQSGQDHHRR